MREVTDIITYLLPHIITAGAYSMQIQREVCAHDSKGGATIFHQALSDADLSVQAYLEVVLLAKYPNLNFFSEEQAVSLNRKYFLGTSGLEVLLDPIDGTRSYIDGRESYQIIVAIHDEREMVGAICYMPRRGRCYVACKDGGAFVLTPDDALAGRKGAKLELREACGPVLVFNAPGILTKLSPTESVVDLLVSYGERPGQHNSTDVLEGRAVAVVHESCQAIDGGALAFIASEGGAIVTSFSGEPVGSFRLSDNRTCRKVIVAANQDIHRRLVTALRNSP